MSTSTPTGPARIHVPVPTATPGPARTRAGAGGPRVRYVGVDLARFLAIAGMMATHLVAITAMLPGLSPFEQAAGSVAQTATSGIAAPLFAVLGGLSLVFASRAPLRDGRRGAAVAGILIRGAILVLVGMLLGMLDVPIVIVLAYYGLAMIIAAPAVLLPSWAIAGIAAVLAVAVPPLNALARSALEVVNEGGSVTFDSFSADPLGAVRGLFLTGEYPAVTWVVYLLVGILIARGFVAATARGTLRRTALIAAAAGAAIAAAAQGVSTWVVANLDRFGFVMPEGVDPEMFRTLLVSPTFGAPFSADPWAMLVATPHSGSPMDLLRTVGIALLVIGLLVAVFDGGRSDREPGFVLNVFRSAGAAPLTIYALHVIATALLMQPAMTALMLQDAPDPTTLPWYAIGLPAFGAQLAGAIVIGAILAALHRRGPLEALVSGTVRLLTGQRRR